MHEFCSFPCGYRHRCTWHVHGDTILTIHCSGHLPYCLCTVTQSDHPARFHTGMGSLVRAISEVFVSSPLRDWSSIHPIAQYCWGNACWCCAGQWHSARWEVFLNRINHLSVWVTVQVPQGARLSNGFPPLLEVSISSLSSFTCLPPFGQRMSSSSWTTSETCIVEQGNHKE